MSSFLFLLLSGFEIGIVGGVGGNGIVCFNGFLFGYVFCRNVSDEINRGVGIHPSIPMEGGQLC
jgi:hypothetical protein